MKILALEISTTSCKAQYYDTLSLESTMLSKQNPKEAGIDDLCLLVIQLGKQLVEGKTLDRITTAGTWHSLVVCDADHNPVMPLTDWTDTSGSKLCEELRKDASYVDSYYRQSGALVNAIYPFFKLLKLEREDSLTNQHLVSSLASHLHYRLTGMWKETASMLSGMGLLSTERVEIHPMAKELSCTIAPIADWDAVSPLSLEAASLLGQSAGIPVLPAFPDGGLNQVGSEAEEPGVLTLSMGTSGALRLCVPKPVFSSTKSTWLYRSPTASLLLGAATSGCTNCVDWYKNSSFDADVSYAMIENTFLHETKIPIFLPFLIGERSPGWQESRQAGFLELTESDTSHTMYQAVLAGVVANLYQCYEKIAENNIPIRTVRLSGGVLHSKFWKEMCCSYFGIPMEEDTQAQASLFGAIVLAARTGNEDLFAITAKKRKVLLPDVRLHELYQKHYQRYLQCYEKTGE